MRLHRYREFKPKFLRDEIVAGKVYLWRLDDQNDPFEGRFSCDLDGSLDAIRRFLAGARGELRSQPNAPNEKAWLFGPHLSGLVDQLRSHLAKASDQEIDRLAVRLHAGRVFAQPTTIESIRAGHERMLSRTVMACFSANEGSPVMFAHYAKHTGVCLTYELEVRDLFQVNYQETLPHLGILDCHPENIVRARLCTKHVDWAYEREYRLVLYDCDVGLYRNERLRLTEIALGCQASDATEREIKVMVADSCFSELVIWRLRPASAGYGFERIRVR